jgi:hypothetical protein
MWVNLEQRTAACDSESFLGKIFSSKKLLQNQSEASNFMLSTCQARRTDPKASESVRFVTDIALARRYFQPSVSEVFHAAQYHVTAT